MKSAKELKALFDAMYACCGDVAHGVLQSIYRINDRAVCACNGHIVVIAEMSESEVDLAILAHGNIVRRGNYLINAKSEIAVRGIAETDQYPNVEKVCPKLTLLTEDTTLPQFNPELLCKAWKMLKAYFPGQFKSPKSVYINYAPANKWHMHAIIYPGIIIGIMPLSINTVKFSEINEYENAIKELFTNNTEEKAA